MYWTAKNVISYKFAGLCWRLSAYCFLLFVAGQEVQAKQWANYTSMYQNTNTSMYQTSNTLMYQNAYTDNDNKMFQAASSSKESPIFQAGQIVQVSQMLLTKTPIHENQIQMSLGQSTANSIRMHPLPFFTEKDREFDFGPLPEIQRPSQDMIFADLNDAHKNYCALAQTQLIENYAHAPDICRRYSFLSYLANFSQYLPILNIMQLLRIKYDSGLSSEQFSGMVSYDSILMQKNSFMSQYEQLPDLPEGSIVSDYHDLKCFELYSVTLSAKVVLPLGFPLDSANYVIDLYNKKCSGKISTASSEEYQNMTSYKMSQRIQPWINWTRVESLNHINPKTFLPPFDGTDKQRQDEKLEAQMLLKKLGYLKFGIGNMSSYGMPNYSKAILDFESDQGMIPDGKLSFMVLMRLRMASSGYDSKYLLED